MKPPLHYLGSKNTLVETIFQYVPSSFKTFIDVFMGSGSVLLYRSRWAEIEIANDKNGDVVNFFRVLRDKPKKLIDTLQLIPHSRREMRESTAIMEATTNPVTRAAYYCVRANQAFAASGRANGGWRLPTFNAIREWHNITDPDYLYTLAARLRRVSLENNTAIKVMKQYDRKDTFFYFDPPYINVAHQKSKELAYQGHDMNEDDHVEFVDHCLKLRGMSIISGYNHPIYDRLVDRGWRKVEIPREVKSINKNTVKNNPDLITARTEILWVSPNIQFVQNSLF